MSTPENQTTSSGLRLVNLGPTDLDRVMALEERAFEAPIRATREMVLHRLSLGHRLLGVESDGSMIGMIGYSFIRFSLDDVRNLPSTFKEYSTQPLAPDPDTVCIYSLGVEPAARAFSVARTLLKEAFDDGRRRGCKAVIGDGEMPSFAGSSQVPARPAVRRMIGRYLATGVFPDQSEFLQDPLLAFHHRATGCRFVELFAGFMPEDEASGGWRVILYQDL